MAYNLLIFFLIQIEMIFWIFLMICLEIGCTCMAPSMTFTIHPSFCWRSRTLRTFALKRFKTWKVRFWPVLQKTNIVYQTKRALPLLGSNTRAVPSHTGSNLYAPQIIYSTDILCTFTNRHFEMIQNCSELRTFNRVIKMSLLFIFSISQCF